MIQIIGNLLEFIVCQTIEEIENDSRNAQGNARIQGHGGFDAHQRHFTLDGIGDIARQNQDARTYNSGQGLCDFTGEVESRIGNAFFTDAVMPFAVVDDVRNESPGDAVRNSQGDVADGDQDDESVNIGRNDEVQEVRSTADEQAADGRSR